MIYYVIYLIACKDRNLVPLDLSNFADGKTVFDARNPAGLFRVIRPLGWQPLGLQRHVQVVRRVRVGPDVLVLLSRHCLGATKTMSFWKFHFWWSLLMKCHLMTPRFPRKLPHKFHYFFHEYHPRLKQSWMGQVPNAIWSGSWESYMLLREMGKFIHKLDLSLRGICPAFLLAYCRI